MVSSNADFPSGFSAEEIVGWNFPETNRSLHADRFEEAHIEPLKAFGPDAAPLVECLGSSEIREAFGKYKKWNSRAIVEQSKYRWQSQVIVFPTIAALAICLILLIPSSLMAEVLTRSIGSTGSGAAKAEMAIRFFAPWMIYFLLVSSLVFKWLLKPEDHYINWHEDRADAEAMRRMIFSRLMRVAPSGASFDASRLLQLKLEYFRRWQVEVQEAYFQKRPQELRQVVKRSNLAQKVYYAVLMLFTVTLLSSCIAGHDEQGPSIIPGAGTWLSAAAANVEAFYSDLWILLVLAMVIVVLGYLGYEAMLGNPLRNARRYETMQENFDRVLTSDLDEARAAARQGDLNRVNSYIEHVHAIMSLEFNDWVRLGKLEVGQDHQSGDEP